MSIGCSETGCIYNNMGECVLSRAMPAGNCEKSSCVYYVERKGEK